MARRVYLHIGTMKSATTYLQQLCELNADHLAASGMLWPEGDLRYQAARDLFGRSPRGVDFSGAWARLARATRRHDGDVLLSNELLAAVNGGHVRRLVKAVTAAKAEAHVVITARDHARLIPSHWQTTIKNGRTHTWACFAAAVCDENADDASRRIHDWFWQRHDIVAIARRWEPFVPLDRLTLVTVPPPEGDPQEMARRFGTALGVDLSGLAQPELRPNSSLGAHSAELMRRLNERVADGGAHVGRFERSHGYRGALGGALALHADQEPVFALTPHQQEWVRRRAHAANADIAALGVRVEGSLGDLVPAGSPPPSAVDPDDTATDDLLAAAQRGLMGMAKTVTDLTLARKEVVAELQTAEQRNAELDRTIQRLRREGARLEAPNARAPGNRPARNALDRQGPAPGALDGPQRAIRALREAVRGVRARLGRSS